MAIVFILFIFLRLVLHANCSGEACLESWTTPTTKYSIINYRGELYVSVSCESKNFKVDGQNLLKCINGLLPKNLPYCIPSKETCHALKAPTFGSMKCSSTPPDVGSRCTFVCLSTHYLKGSNVRVCTRDRRWTGSVARCFLKPECPEPPSLQQGTVSGCSIDRKPKFNDKCYFRCNEGFLLVGPSEVICRLNGMLTDQRGRQVSPSCHSRNSTIGDFHSDKGLQNQSNPVSLISCQFRNGNCSHYCHQDTKGVQCSCRNGYKLSQDGKTCIDIDECSIKNGGCEGLCRNTNGSFTCSCQEGYTVSPNDKYRCDDIDECSIKNGGCEGLCHNTNGSFTCSCREGFTKSPNDKYRCDDIDECSIKNGGCEELCRNTVGSFTCSCREGYTVSPHDKYRCDDIDECSIKNGGCEGLCHNTNGSFTCSCPEGYTESPHDKYRCDDVDECSEGNGGCGGQCVNYQGGFHCSCPEGHYLHPDGKTCIAFYCPRMSIPHHSTLRCKNNTGNNKVIFRPGKMPDDQFFPVGATCKIKCDKGYDIRDSYSAIICQNDGKWNASLPECEVLKCSPLTPPLNGDVHPSSCKEGLATVKEKCVFTCQSGYRITGQEVLTCRNNLTWSKKKQTQCVPETEVSISCPDDDITIELMSNESRAEIRLNSPRTTLQAGSIAISPTWVSLDRVTIFPAGVTEITFSVTSHNKTAECSLSVIILDKHPPVFRNCPFTLFLTSGVGGTAVNWEEPIPEDNVGIASVSKNLEPNSTLSPGLHFVEYVARDYAGNIGQCIFHINVTAGDCKDLADPENGEANCLEWMFGKICQPTCFDNFSRPSELFACDESGKWTPTHFISPCLPECFEDKMWSPELQKCISI